MPVVDVRCSRRHGFIAATLALGLVAAYFGERTTRVFLAPVLDVSTPAAQSGFKMERITLGEIFFSVPRLASEDAAHFHNLNASELFTVTTRTPDGDLHSCGCDIAEVDGKQLLRTQITKSWPESVPWVDLFVKDSYGHLGRWRLTRLSPLQPRAVNVFPGSDTFHFGGATIQAHAERDWEDSVPASWPKPGRFGMIIASVRGTGVPTPQGHWELGHISGQDNWTTIFPGLPRDGGWENTIFMPFALTSSKAALYPGPDKDCPYPSQVRQIEIGGTLQQFDCCDEQVVFHDVDLRPDQRMIESASRDNPYFRFATVSQTQTVTTPSGIVVTLPAQDTEKPWEYSTAIHLVMPPYKSKITLPRSPLWQKYHRPASISVVASNPLVAVRYGVPGDTWGYYFGWPSLGVSHLKTLTFTIRQRIELQTVPFTLTLAPKDTVIHRPDH